MTTIEDDHLREQLLRRAASAPSVGLLAEAVRSEVATVKQLRPRPWDGMRGWPSTRAARPAWLAAALTLSVVGVLAGSTLLRGSPASGPVPTTDPSGTSAWWLTLDQLQRVVSRARTDAADIGKVIVADVPLRVEQNLDCATTNNRCPSSITLGNPFTRIPLTGGPAIPYCGVSNFCRPPQQFTGPVALRIHAGSVEYVGLVQSAPRGGAVAWSVAEARDALAGPIDDRSQGMVVDGWLVTDGALYFCPAHINRSGDPDADGYGCGSATWLTPGQFQPTTTTQVAGPTSFPAVPPSDGIRVQNAAYALSRAPASSGTSPLPDQEHGLYLLLPPPAGIDPCWSCDPGPLGFVLARIDPVEVPAGPPAVPSTQNPAVSTPAGPALRSIDQEQLVAAVRQAAAGTGVGRVVVADVRFEQGGDCRGSGTAPSCYGVIAGSDPPIQLIGGPADTCLSGAHCPFEGNGPFVPTGGPFALRLRQDGAIDWLDRVWTQNDGSIEWSFDQFKDRLGRLQFNETDAHVLYVVSGWATQSQVTIDCWLPPPALTDGRFACSDQAAWFEGAGPTSPITPVAPKGSIRLQNGAMGLLAPGPGTLGVPGTFLVRPVVPPPQPCFLCDDSGLAAELVGQLDPP